MFSNKLKLKRPPLIVVNNLDLKRLFIDLNRKTCISILVPAKFDLHQTHFHRETKPLVSQVQVPL